MANRFTCLTNARFEIAFSAFVDLYLATYPAFILFHLQMSLRKKIALSAALGLGTVYVVEDFNPSSYPFVLLA